MAKTRFSILAGREIPYGPGDDEPELTGEELDALRLGVKIDRFPRADFREEDEQSLREGAARDLRVANTLRAQQVEIAGLRRENDALRVSQTKAPPTDAAPLKSLNYNIQRDRSGYISIATSDGGIVTSPEGTQKRVPAHHFVVQERDREGLAKRIALLPGPAPMSGKRPTRGFARVTPENVEGSIEAADQRTAHHTQRLADAAGVPAVGGTRTRAEAIAAFRRGDHLK